MKQIGTLTLIAACIGVFAIGDAQAQQQDLSGGFYGRVSFGLGTARTGFATENQDFDDQDATLGGFSVSYDAALGFELPLGLAIHGSYRGWTNTSPKFKIDGDEVAEFDDAKLALHNFGIGVTFSPSIFYISYMVGPAWLKYEFGGGADGSTRDNDSWGIGSELGLGAMFFNVPGFSLGLGAFGSFHWIAETSESDKGLLGYQAGGRLILEF